jgi:pimeloyl-ACP methyl ester carboxylesterase
MEPKYKGKNRRLKNSLYLKQFVFAALLCVFFLGESCRKESVVLSANANDIFWLNNAGADMPIWIKGNTSSGVIILFVHGGPGDGSYQYVDFQTDQLWKNYAVAYWDQRDAGAAAGNNNYSNLNLNQMIDDLKKVIILLKYRYGGQQEIFLMAHSFGALLAAGYLVQSDNQDNVKGWIEVDGAHDYPESNVLERQMLIDTGTLKIGENSYAAQWQQIVDYCNTHRANQTLEADLQMDNYAAQAENYEPINHTATTLNFFSPSSPISYGINLFYLYNSNAGKSFLDSIEKISYTNQLYKITVPSLLIWGQYDFTVPFGCGTQALPLLGSSYKKLVIMPHSGHIPMNSDTNLFTQTVTDFIQTVR